MGPAPQGHALKSQTELYSGEGKAQRPQDHARRLLARLSRQERHQARHLRRPMGGHVMDTHLLSVQANVHSHQSLTAHAAGSLALGKQSMGDSSSLGYRVSKSARLECQCHEASGAARAAGRRPGLRADI